MDHSGCGKALTTRDYSLEHLPTDDTERVCLLVKQAGRRCTVFLLGRHSPLFRRIQTPDVRAPRKRSLSRS